MIAIDFGVDSKLALYEEGRLIEAPKWRGLSGAEKFHETLRWALERGDVVTESATVGSCGAEPEAVRDIVSASSNTLFTVSNRAVKNYCGRTSPLDGDAARFIYEIATQNPAALKTWRFVPAEEKFKRMYRSVRPHDKRGYKTPEVEAWLAKLPDPASLSDELREIFTKNKTPKYVRARALPFAMALDEDLSSTRAGYEKVLGLYAHGYPSFYRRATISLMQIVGRRRFGVKPREFTPEQRKEAWKVTRRLIRQLYALSRKSSGIYDPETGNPPPGVLTGNPNPGNGQLLSL